MRERVEVKIGGKTIQVDVYQDKETTLRLAALVNKRIKQIEGQNDRIDTQAFALEAALSFAAQGEAAETGRKEDSKEMMIELERLSGALRAIEDDHRMGD